MIKQCRNLDLPEPEFVSIRGVEFRAIMAREIFTENMISKLGLNERQLKAVKYVKEKGRITNKEYQEINKVSNKTAYLDLSEIVQKNILTIEGIGRNVSYMFKVMKK